MEYQPIDFSISPDRQWVYFLNTTQGIIYKNAWPIQKI